MRQTQQRTKRDERGIGGIEVLSLGFLVLVVGTLIVASAWGVVDAKMAALAASREGVRVAVESAGGKGNARSRAHGAAVDAWTSLGRKERTLDFTLSGSLARCQRVTGVAETTISPFRFPWVGAWGDITVTARHTEIVDPYRSGLIGEAVCND